MTPEADAPSLRLSAGTVAPYLGGCALVAAGIWGSAHTSAAWHDALLVITGLLCLYLAYLAAIFLFVVGVAAWMSRLSGLRHRDQRVPMAWRVVLAWWVLGVVGATLITWVGMGVRGEEARWLIGSYLVGGLVVGVVFGKAGWDEKRAASQARPASGRHCGS